MAPEPLATADLSDAADGRIAMDPRIRPLWNGARLAGPALTAQTPPGQHAAVREALERAAPGDVIVVDGDGAVERALWGGRMSRLALERGVAGLVVDGAVRDLAEIERLGFPVFAITSVPTAPHRDGSVEVGVPITCGGLRVEPGDLVYGDADGVVVVPQAAHTDVVERATALAAAGDEARSS